MENADLTHSLASNLVEDADGVGSLSLSRVGWRRHGHQVDGHGILRADHEATDTHAGRHRHDSLVYCATTWMGLICMQTRRRRYGIEAMAVEATPVLLQGVDEDVRCGADGCPDTGARVCAGECTIAANALICAWSYARMQHRDSTNGSSLRPTTTTSRLARTTSCDPPHRPGVVALRHSLRQTVPAVDFAGRKQHASHALACTAIS